MLQRSITANPSQIVVEQLAASGVKYVFYNSGSREALFFDALHLHPEIHGILALHEGSVAAMAGGYAQAKLEPAVMLVHLGAGLSQCLGQLINVWSGGLPVVVITFAADTGSYADRVGLDLNHNFGPTSISAPFTKANWTVIEPEGLPQAIHRALQVAKASPVAPVHLALYDRLLGEDQVTTSLIPGQIPTLRAGYPADGDIETLAHLLNRANSPPVLYVGDGVWKSGAEAGVLALAEHFGLPIVGDTRSISIKHPLHCGRLTSTLNGSDIICIGLRQGGRGKPQDFEALSTAQRIIAIGADMENIKNIPNLDLAILADEKRTLERLNQLVLSQSRVEGFEPQRSWAREQAASWRAQRQQAAQQVEPVAGRIRPWLLAESLDQALERRGGGLISVEQYAVPLDLFDADPASRNVYIRAAGGSEGYGIGGTIGVKLAAPEKTVVGLIGDGSMFYADSGLWTAAHHQIPVLYVVSNNQAYGVVAGSFSRSGGVMSQKGEYAGVVLDGIDPVKIGEGFGIEGRQVEEESSLSQALEQGLEVVEREERPFLLNVHLPLGLPKGGRAATPFRFSNQMTGNQA